jgi:hypothetical protein
MRKQDTLRARLGRGGLLVMLLGLLALGAADRPAHTAADVCAPCTFERVAKNGTADVCSPCSF